MSTDRKLRLDRQIEDTASEIREIEKTLDATWWRNIVKDGEEMAQGHFEALVNGSLTSVETFVQHLELRGQLRGIQQYGGLIMGRLDTLKQTLQQLKQEYENEPEDDSSST